MLIFLCALWLLDLAVFSNMALGDTASAPVDSVQETFGALSNDLA
jgi:hypothetical protein